MTHTEKELNREKTTSICLILQSHRCTVHQYTAPCLAFSSGHTDTLSMQMFQSETSLHLQQRGWIWTFYCYCLHLSLIVKAHTISRKKQKSTWKHDAFIGKYLSECWSCTCSPPEVETCVTDAALNSRRLSLVLISLCICREAVFTQNHNCNTEKDWFFFYNRLRIAMMTHQMLMAVMWRILIHFLNDI